MAIVGRRKGAQALFVEPYRQVKLGLFFVLINITFSFLILGTFGYYIYDIFETLQEHFKLTNDESVVTLAKLSVPLGIAVALLVVFIGLTFYISAKYTHRIYGPLVSIHRFLDEMLEGKVPQPLNLRESDQLQDLAEKLNQIAKNVAQKK